MLNYLSTWMYVEDKTDGGIYPQVGGGSASQTVQNIYWRCVYVFFHTAKLTAGDGSDLRLILFTNAKALPVVDELDLEPVLADLGVEIVRLPYLWRPQGPRRTWLNQYYLFDILTYMQERMAANDGCIVADNDCVFVRDPADAFLHLRKNGYLTITVDTNEDEDINGISRRESMRVYEEISGVRPQHPPQYFGGEIYGFMADSLRSVMAMAADCKTANDKRAIAGEPYLCDEAHMVSYLLWRLGQFSPTGNLIARRIWTTWKLNNTRPADLDLVLWHLPAEKIYGFKQVFAALQSGRSFNNPQELKSYLAHQMGVGRKSAHKFAGHFARALWKHIKKQSASLKLPLILRRSA